MPRLASGDEKPPMSAEARRWWPAPREVRAVGGRSELEPSGVLFLFAAMLDISAVDYSCSAVLCNGGWKFCGRLSAPPEHGNRWVAGRQAYKGEW